MKRIVLNLALLFGLAVVVAGCRTAPIYNVNNASLPISAGHSLEEVSKAIKLAGAGLGWQIKEIAPGKDIGTLVLRSHTAIVNIDYTTTNVSINYKDSVDLKFDGSNIHKNYNGWIQNLENAIMIQTSAL